MGILERLRRYHKRRMEKRNQGIIYVWVVCLTGIVVYSICWFSLGWAAFSVMDAIEAGYTFSSPADTTVTLTRLVIAWHPILFMIGLLLWAIVNSQRRETVTYPRYRR